MFVDTSSTTQWAIISQRNDRRASRVCTAYSVRRNETTARPNGFRLPDFVAIEELEEERKDICCAYMGRAFIEREGLNIATIHNEVQREPV